MATRYASYLIRCWALENGDRRLMVEHLQSDERTLADTLERACAWIAGRDHLGGARQPPGGSEGSARDPPPENPAPGDADGRGQSRPTRET